MIGLRVRMADGTTAPVVAIERENGRWWLLVFLEGALVTLLPEDVAVVSLVNEAERAQEAIAPPGGPGTPPRRRKAAQGRGAS